MRYSLRHATSYQMVCWLAGRASPWRLQGLETSKKTLEKYGVARTDLLLKPWLAVDTRWPGCFELELKRGGGPYQTAEAFQMTNS